MTHSVYSPGSLEEVLHEFGLVGERLAAIKAIEGGAGNISVCFEDALPYQHLFPLQETIQLPDPAPALAGRILLVTGSGQRLRDLSHAPLCGLGLLKVNPGGETGLLFSSPQRGFTRLSSEFNSHLGVHHDFAQNGGRGFHSLVHAQPPHLTFLSHITRYQDQSYLNRALMRWQPETIITFPQGFGVLPFAIPGSPAMKTANVEKMRKHRLVIWSKHGVLARHAGSLLVCADLIEYAEAAAYYEYLNLSSGEPSTGLSPDEIRRLSEYFQVSQDIF
jgi:rhamnulose-1-phosphate aldolase